MFKKSIRHLLLCLLPLLPFFDQLNAERGLAVACNDYYLGYFLPSLAYLRQELNCDLPVEVWYAGDELSEKSKKLLRQFSNIRFYDLVDEFGGDAKIYRGYQIKGYMLKGSKLDEVMIVDADVYFAKNPKELFFHPHYLKTGAFFFRDFKMKHFCHLHDEENETEKGCFQWKHGYLESYYCRRDFLRGLIPTPSESLPADMRFFWDEFEPTPEEKFLIHYQESGVVLIDKKRHKRGVHAIYQLNVDYKNTYKIVYGDKETFWIGMEMAKEPYSFNRDYPINIRGKWLVYGIKRKKIRLVHRVDGKLFWFQKKPVSLGSHPIYKSYEGEDLGPLSKKDVLTIDRIGFYVDMFGLPTRE